MAFPTIKDPICTEDGVFAYNFTASGSIKAGQVVYASGNGYGDVMVVDGDGWATTGPAAGYKSLGVASYDVDHGDKVAVYGPGNIVRCAATGAVDIGQPVVGTTDGWISGAIAFPSGACDGTALEEIGAGATGRVMWGQ